MCVGGNANILKKQSFIPRVVGGWKTINGNINNEDCFIAHLIMWIVVLMGVVVLVLLLVMVIVGLLLQ